MILWGAGLEHGFLFEQPGGGGIPAPGFQSGHGGFDFGEILAVVRAEIKAGPLACPAGDCLEEFGFQQAVFVVPGLGPGIGEEHPDFFKRDAR